MNLFSCYCDTGIVTVFPAAVTSYNVRLIFVLFNKAYNFYLPQSNISYVEIEKNCKIVENMTKYLKSGRNRTLF